jgi:hypothetical protein
MKSNAILAAALALGLLGCGGKKLDEAEVLDLLTKPSAGVIGGWALGDSWSKIQASHDARYAVRDLPQGHQLFQDHGMPMWGVNVIFQVDGDKVARFQVDVQGRERNDDDSHTIRDLDDALKAYFDKKAAAKGCSQSDDQRSTWCAWTANDGTQIDVTWRRLADFSKEDLEVNVTPAGSI